MPKQYDQVTVDRRSSYLCPLQMLRGLEDQRCVRDKCMWFDQAEFECLVGRLPTYDRS